ncbi:phytanoyl-CoA dioxygenase family protein [Gellertiella hungarica]|uniref:Ectoine hydroxylase-related dioxygenase (Phytanoyl-CoA dioxygenase family) n=1 Tax=Gellertiella hungarica TaxID=1572859 RepID=A0A7W6NLT5_9HYPH|nr:phytanoyl-CoA dioxygenase family protein [Gellertiella hungarica]MBB4065785.1 ectoine hydroxylase-related dioxygenase (phytanoyl-CoA dioxygenase family) [Gellertiella hungarica]
MDQRTLASRRREKVWLSADSGSLDAFRALVEREAKLTDWPFAARIEKNVLIYDGERVRSAASDPEARRELMAEWVEAFSDGPGVIVIKNALTDHAVIDRASAVFEEIIAQEKQGGKVAGDHFAKPGANDRIWNSLEKHCLKDPDNFARYYASDAIALASEAWLGRGYQMTAQMNRVNPGGAAQKPHRDYHLGFMSPAQMQDFPGHIHAISPVLTLQGAVAHCDMPLESGPTLLLPFSQSFFEGYIAFGRPEFQAYFAEHHVQLPLEKGDALFFNPALMHGAGNNVSKDIYRMANLLQVSSAFGRAMESVNRARMVVRLYPALLEAARSGSLGPRAIANAVAASAEGYAFPTNLDSDPPVGGLAPKTQAAHMMEALEARLDPDAFASMIAAHAARREA